MRFLVPMGLTLAATSALAQTTPPQPLVSAECRAEVVKLCPQTGDRAARRQCMLTNRDKISEGCRAQIRAAMEARRGARGGNGDMAAPGAMQVDPPKPD